MKNVFKVLGIIALVAVIGFSMAGCKNDDDSNGSSGGGGGGGGGAGSALVGKWYSTQTAANAGTGSATYEFSSDGKIFVGGNSVSSLSYTATANTITTTTSGVSLGTINYKIEGTKLTLTGAATSGLAAGDYFKKAN